MGDPGGAAAPDDDEVGKFSDEELVDLLEGDDEVTDSRLLAIHPLALLVLCLCAEKGCKCVWIHATKGLITPAPSTNPQCYYHRGGYKWGGGGVYHTRVCCATSRQFKRSVNCEFVCAAIPVAHTARFNIPISYKLQHNHVFAVLKPCRGILRSAVKHQPTTAVTLNHYHCHCHCHCHCRATSQQSAGSHS